jgi:hypothetical protein
LPYPKLKHKLPAFWIHTVRFGSKTYVLDPTRAAIQALAPTGGGSKYQWTGLDTEGLPVTQMAVLPAKVTVHTLITLPLAAQVLRLNLHRPDERMDAPKCMTLIPGIRRRELIGAAVLTRLSLSIFTRYSVPSFD